MDNIPVTPTTTTPTTVADPNVTPLSFSSSLAANDSSETDNDVNNDPNATALFVRETVTSKAKYSRSNYIIIFISLVIIVMVLYGLFCSFTSANAVSVAQPTSIVSTDTLPVVNAVPAVPQQTTAIAPMTFGAPQLNLQDLADFRDLDIL